MKKLIINGETVNYIQPHKSQNIAQALQANIPDLETFPKSWLNFPKSSDSKMWRENLKNMIEEYAKEKGQKVYVKFSAIHSNGAYSIDAVFFVPDSIALNFERKRSYLRRLLIKEKAKPQLTVT